MARKSTLPDQPLALETVWLDELRPHPRNYQAHPDDEIEHLMESLRANGVYRNILVAEDGVTILAGHGVVEAARRLPLETLPARRMPFSPDDPRALKLLASDNEISHLAEVDDRLLTELLKEIQESAGLLGTGYDEAMLANLVMVTRPASEIADLDAAAHWVGMPEYDDAGGERAKASMQLLMQFRSQEDKIAFCQQAGFGLDPREQQATIWWPARPKDDVRSLRFTARSTVGGDEDEE